MSKRKHIPGAKDDQARRIGEGGVGDAPNVRPIFGYRRF